MQRLNIDMPPKISAAIRHGADHHGKNEVVTLAIDHDIHHFDHATGLARVWLLDCLYRSARPEREVAHRLVADGHGLG